MNETGHQDTRGHTAKPLVVRIVRLQQEAGQWWSNLLNQAPSAQDWPKHFTSFAGVASGVMPVAQKRMEEVMDLMEKNSQASAELLKKAAVHLVMFAVFLFPARVP